MEDRTEKNAAVTVAPDAVELEDDLFRGMTHIRRVILPDTLKSIGWGSFCGCSALEELVIPQGVTSIGPYAFRDCVSLKRITLPETLESIGQGAFARCVSLEEVIIPSNVREIDLGAFREVPAIRYTGNLPIEDFWGAVSCNGIRRHPGMPGVICCRAEELAALAGAFWTYALIPETETLKKNYAAGSRRDRQEDHRVRWEEESSEDGQPLLVAWDPEGELGWDRCSFPGPDGREMRLLVEEDRSVKGLLEKLRLWCGVDLVLAEAGGKVEEALLEAGVLDKTQ